MRSNGRPSVPLSSLPPAHVEVFDGSAVVVCAHCRTWVPVLKALVQAHRHNGTRCPGAGQHITFDCTPAQLGAARAIEVRAAREAVATAPRSAVDPSTRRATAVRALVYPPAPTPVHRIAAARAA